MSNVTEEFDTSQAIYEQLCHGKSWPLPRRTPNSPKKDCYEVIVSGAGPAGLFLTLYLARLGLNNDSLLCVDRKAHATNIGHADGINARTQEILATFNLDYEIHRRGRRFTVASRWMHSGGESKFIQTTQLNLAPSRFSDLRALHQARLERTMLADLKNYSNESVKYGIGVTNAVIDNADAEYPVVVTLEEGGTTREVRTKYLVGADGAHSSIRRSMNILLDGDTSDQSWGVIEFVPDSDFPSIRTVNQFFNEDNLPVGLVIPREQLSNGEYMVRFYCDMSNVDLPQSRDRTVNTNGSNGSYRAQHTKEAIMEQANKLVSPCKVRAKKGTSPYWWATYSVGQRLAQHYIVEDDREHPRIFLVGDACHTHTPLQGQGLNISIQDSYNLGWKLAYTLFGLSPHPTELLRTYEQERRPFAERVIFFDKRWNQNSIPWEEKFQEMREQVSNCGVQYEPNLIISDKNDNVNFEGKELLSGLLKVGRRLLNVKLKRYADVDLRDIHDDLPSNGKYRILLLADGAFLTGRSRKAMEAVCSIGQGFPDNIVEVIILQQDMTPEFGWSDLPGIVKEMAEMRLYCAQPSDFDTYGVDPKEGVIAVIRPDGHVCLTTSLDEFDQVGKILRQVLLPSAGN